MHSLSLKIRITALAMLVAIVPLMVSQLISANRTSETLLNSSALHLENRSLQIASVIDRYINKNIVDVLAIAKADILQSANSGMIEGNLKRIRQLNSSIRDIAIIDKQGIIRHSSNENENGVLLWELYLGVKELFLSSLNTAKDKVYISEAHYSETGLRLMLLAPVVSAISEEITGILLVKTNLSEINKIVDDFPVQDQPGLFTYLVDKLGNVMLSTNDDVKLFSRLADLRLQPAMLSNNSHGTLTYINALDKEVMTGYADMPEYGENRALDWSVISIYPVATILQPANETRNMLMIVGFSLTALVTLIAYIFARGIALPLKRTAVLAAEICRGDYSHRLESNLGGEIGALSTAINEMADRIDERTAEIVNRNEKLTSEITERKLAEDRLKMLSHKIIRLQEEERRRVSRELHDGINQLLVSVKYKLENYVDKFHQQDGQKFNDITNAVVFLDEAISEVRRISHDLRPSVLDDLGISAAIKNISRQFYERNQIDVEIEGIDEAVLQRLPVDVETALYRIVQEALMNIEKHAEATKVVINMTHTDITVTIRIEDNGNGFDLQGTLRKNSSTSQGIGLRNMRERIELLQGTFFIHSELGRGTFIEVEAPFNLE